MSSFHALMVSSITRETPDCVSVVLDVPDTLSEEFRYIQGQHLTFRGYFNGEDVRRNYSICCAPSEQTLKVAVKKLEGGIFSSYINDELKPGDRIDTMPPMGRFYTALNPAAPKNYLAFVCGSGITPVISNIKAILNQESESTFQLIFGNKGSDHVIFREELEALKNQFLHRFAVQHLFSREHQEWPLFYGRINGEKLRSFQGRLFHLKTVDEVFICGPQEMMEDLSDTLQALGFDKENIHTELFAAQSMASKDTRETDQNPEDRIDSSVTVIMDGNKFQFEIHNDESILDAANTRGANLPFACKGGVCCTCKAKLISGDVRMDANFGLEEDEIQAGYVLTCQAHPQSDEVIIDFDV